jgi:hypothetical protein
LSNNSIYSAVVAALAAFVQNAQALRMRHHKRQ